jgi:hypothetical protein
MCEQPLAQQNAFNEAAFHLIVALVERVDRADAEIQHLRQELESSGTETQGESGTGHSLPP